MFALLSIKPKYVEAIMRGDKRYEFRKSIFRQRNVAKIYIYSTSPVKKVVGAFGIGKIIEDHPKQLWNRLSLFSGLDDIEFFKYFKDIERGFAIEIKNLEKFKEPINPWNSIPHFVPPQSFCYIEPNAF